MIEPHSLPPLLDEVSAESLMAFTQSIAREVRLSGTAEERRAFEFVQSTLDGFGFRTRLMECDAFISLPGEAHLKVGSNDIPCITHSMAAATPEGGLKAALVDVGQGTPQDYLQGDVAGKIVVVEGLASPAPVMVAQEAGAAGAIFINAEHTYEMIVSAVWGNPTPDTLSLLPRIPVVSVTRRDGDSIKANLKRETSHAWMQTSVDTGWRKIPTLEANLPGKVEPENFVLFSGHIDCWHYGAMDNGSANATMLEVARILSRHPETLRRSLRLAFWSGHSHGRYAGSTWYCDTHWEELHEHCVLHVNVDSLGGKGATILSEAPCTAESKALATDPIQLLANQEYVGSRFGRAGDQSFWGPGVPSLFMGLSEQAPASDPAAQAFASLFGGGRAGGFGWWWHTKEDTIDKLDPSNLIRDCKVYLSVIHEACAARLLPLDQLAAVRELKVNLDEYQQAAGTLFDLSTATRRVEQLETHLDQLHTLLEKASFSELQVLTLNRGLMELSRTLIPLNYVRGSIYEHDPALGQPPIAALEDIHHLAKAENDEVILPLRTLLTRRLNRVNHALLLANRSAEQLLSVIKS